MQFTYKCELEARSRNHCCSRKARIIACSHFVFVILGIQHAMRMRHIFVCVLWLHCILPRYLLKGNILWGESCWTQKCVVWFSVKLLSETFLIPRRIQPDITTNVLRCSCKAPVFLFTFQSNSNFLDRFSENVQMSHFTIFVRWEPSCCMRTDGWTWRT